MNIIDIILGIFLLVLLFHGFIKGFVKSIISLASLVVIVLLIAKTGHIVKGMLILRFGFSELLAAIFSYILIAVAIIIIAKITIKILQMIIEFLHLKWLDRLLGAFFGIFNGVLIIAIFLLLLNLFPLRKHIRVYTSDSIITTNILNVTDKIEIKHKGIKEKVKDLGIGLEKRAEEMRNNSKTK